MPRPAQAPGRAPPLPGRARAQGPLPLPPARQSRPATGSSVFFFRVRVRFGFGADSAASRAGVSASSAASAATGAASAASSVAFFGARRLRVRFRLRRGLGRFAVRLGAGFDRRRGGGFGRRRIAGLRQAPPTSLPRVGVAAFAAIAATATAPSTLLLRRLFLAGLGLGSRLRQFTSRRLLTALPAAIGPFGLTSVIRVHRKGRYSTLSRPRGGGLSCPYDMQVLAVLELLGTRRYVRGRPNIPRIRGPPRFRHRKMSDSIALAPDDRAMCSASGFHSGQLNDSHPARLNSQQPPRGPASARSLLLRAGAGSAPPGAGAARRTGIARLLPMA